MSADENSQFSISEPSEGYREGNPLHPLYNTLSLNPFRKLHHPFFRVVFHATNWFLRPTSVHPFHRPCIIELDDIFHGTCRCWRSSVHWSHLDPHHDLLARIHQPIFAKGKIK